MNPLTIHQIQESAEFSNFCQRVKMKMEKANIYNTDYIDEILLIVWQELKK